MKLVEIRERAKQLGIKGAAKMRKGVLIRAIQEAEGNPQCFGAEWRFKCPEFQCCWRDDCLTDKPG